MKTLSEHTEKKERNKVIAKKMTSNYLDCPQYMSSTRQLYITAEEKEAFAALSDTHSACNSIKVATVKMSVGDHVLYHCAENAKCDTFKLGEIRVVLYNRNGNRCGCMFAVKEKDYHINDTFQCLEVKAAIKYELISSTQLASHVPLRVVELKTHPKSVIALTSEPTLCYVA